MNPNYATVVKQNIDKLLTTWFIQLVEEATWLSLIMVMPKKEWKIENLCGFQEVQ